MNATPFVLVVFVLIAVSVWWFQQRGKGAAATGRPGALPWVKVARKAGHWLGFGPEQEDLPQQLAGALARSFSSSTGRITCARIVHIRVPSSEYEELRSELQYLVTALRQDVNERGQAWARRSRKSWAGCPEFEFHLHRGPLAVVVTRDPNEYPKFDDSAGPDFAVERPRTTSPIAVVDHGRNGITPATDAVGAGPASVPATDDASCVPVTQAFPPRYSLVLSINGNDVDSIDVPQSPGRPLDVKLGRGPGNDLIIPAEHSKVSRTHLQLTFADKGIYATDRSAWGSWHRPEGNWHRLPEGTPTFLADDDVVALTGDFALQVRMEPSMERSRS